MEFLVEMGPDLPPTSCDCCNQKTLHAHGYVYRDGDARAAYHAFWTLGHPDEGIRFVVGLGEWGKGTSPEARFAFSLDFRPRPQGSCGFRLVNASRAVREEAVALGRPMDREDALDHPLTSELFAICEVLLTEDSRIRDFLAAA